MRLKKYDRDASHSYTFGVFPTLELLHHQPKQVSEILLTTAGAQNEGVAKIKALCSTGGIPISTDDKLVERIAPKENTYAVGVFAKYNPVLDAQANHVVLVNPSDMGNLGTILRTILGFGCRDLALIRPAADIFDPRAVRASMGALFQINFAYFESIAEYQAAFSHALYPFMTDGEVILPEAAFQTPFALVFGNESSGLDESFRALGTTISIPQSGAIDSLNLSIAVGVALYEATNN